MGLSHDLVSQFAKIVNKDMEKPSETTVYGTVVTDGEGNKYVKLDGSDQWTPITNTSSSVKADERVSVLIKDHSATVTGNLSSPSVRTGDFNDLNDQVTKIEQSDLVLAKRVEANEGYIQQLDADKASFGDLDAATASITELVNKKASTEELNAAKADITDLDATKIDAEVANAKFATIDNLNAATADISDLKTKNATIEGTLNAHNAAITNLGTTYANIDFSNIGMAAVEKLFTKSGIIKDLVAGDTSITGELVGVTIKGDLIEGNTIKADKLVVKGSDGLFYKLNVDALGETTASSDEKYQNGLDGSVIVANSITAEKINVKDLVAFGATIGGFHITDDSIYSGAKTSSDNTTRGIFLSDDGQFAVGDQNNFLKFYKDTDGTYKLAISAASMIFSSSGNSVETAINDVAKDANTITYQVRDELENSINAAKTEIDGRLKGYVETETYKNDKTEINGNINDKFGEAANQTQQVQNDANNRFDKIATYIRFDEDGVELGKDGNSRKLRVDNDTIKFIDNDEPVSEWDGENFHTGNIKVDVLERAQFGNFAFVPRSDGSLSFLKVDNVISGNIFNNSMWTLGIFDKYEFIGTAGIKVSYMEDPDRNLAYIDMSHTKKYRLSCFTKNIELYICEGERTDNVVNVDTQYYMVGDGQHTIDSMTNIAEIIITAAKEYTLLATKPTDWDSGSTDYYIKDDRYNGFRLLDTGQHRPAWEANKYYSAEYIDNAEYYLIQNIKLVEVG